MHCARLAAIRIQTTRATLKKKMLPIGTFGTYEVKIEFDPARPRTILRSNVRPDGAAILGASYNGQWLEAYIVPEIMFEDVVVVYALVGLD